MKRVFQRLIVAALAVTLTVTMFPLPAFAVEGDTPDPADTQQVVQEDQQTVQEDLSGQEDETAPVRSTNPQRKRTILLYDCGSDLETDAGLASYNLKQILRSRFSSDDDITFLVMTGGSHKWQLDNDNDPGNENGYLTFPEGSNLPGDAVVPYDFNNRTYGDEQSDPESQISNVYNQIWEARGADAKINNEDDPNAGKLVLLDGDGITGDNEPVQATEELMSDPAILKAFINYGAANYPAEKYDLILWDHGGGPKSGFGVDEHHDDSDDWSAPSIMSFEGIIEALSDNAVTNNDADGDGRKDKFDFINFDACLMNSVELALVMADYTDYYIASAETEPGYGQYYGPCADQDGKQYKGWLDELGNPANDEKYNAADGTYELGKVIVDDFYNFYEKETGDGASQEGTLAVVDTKKMMDSQFVNTLTALTDVIRAEAGNVEEDGLHFYDELKSYYNSIEYGGSELFDLGNVAALLSVVNSEVSEEHMDEQDNYYINANKYHDISGTLNHLLADGKFMYAKGTSGITTADQYYRTLDDQLGYGRLGSSGMSIFFPGLEMTMSVKDYFREIDPVIERLPEGDKRKAFFKDYEAALAYFGLILYSGKTIDLMINDEDGAAETAGKSDVDYDLVMAQMKQQYLGNWDTLVVPCMEKAGLDEEGIENWFHALIPQQADDAVDGKEVSLERLDQDETGACTVTVNGARKRIVNSVQRNIYVELPALEEYVNGLDAEQQKTVNNAGQLSVGSIEGTIAGQPAGDFIRDMIRWYNESGGIWHIDPFEEKWYAACDAGGAEHVASIYLSDEDGIYVPALIETEADGTVASREIMLEFSPEDPAHPEESHRLLSFYYMNTEAGPVQIEPKNLTREITVMPALVIRQMFDPDIYVPISKTSFTISADNADSISLDLMDIANIRDIGDTDGDGRIFDTAITITDMYGYQIHVSDRIHIKKARVKPAIYTGEELEPEVAYLGDTLRPGIDYICEKERVWNEETHTLDVPAFIEPGDYKVALYGKGHYTGRKYDAVFSIVRGEEAAQALVDQAKSELSAAQTAMKAAIESGSQRKLEEAYAALVNAQNALEEAQAILAKEKQAELEDQIGDLEQQIEDLNEQLAEVTVVDISGYAVTMKSSYPYTGKAIKPAVKISGLNESCYTVSYSNNTKIGTAKVIIKAKGDRYKGTITKTFKITKGINTLAVKGKTATVKYKKLKKKAQKLKAAKVIRITNKGQGKLTYAKVSGNKKITINKKTGKVTIKKKLKKGTYKVNVKVKAAGDKNYKASAWKTVTFKLKVR